MRKKRLASTVAATVAAGGVLSGLLGGTAAAADPAPLCRAADVIAEIVPEQRGGGEEAFAIIYTAANPDTDCTLRGAPPVVTFLNGDKLVAEVTSSNTEESPEVRLSPGNQAASSIIVRPDGTTRPVTRASVGIPTQTQGNIDALVVPWPADAPLHGTAVELTPVVPLG